jgi:hypothetical protein
MSVRQYGGDLIEISVLSGGPDFDGWAVEVWNLTQVTGRTVMEFHLTGNGEVTIDLHGFKCEVGFLRWVLDLVEVELEGYR